MLASPMAGHRVALRALFLSTIVVSAACGGGPRPAPKPPAFDPKGQTKCGVSRSQARPLIVEWPAADSVALEAQAKKGLVFVRYEGCEMEVLRRCSAAGAYKYTGTTRRDDEVSIRDQDELYANIPVHAAQLEATLRRAGELHVSMSMVGSYDADRGNVRKDELQGDCSAATHVITGLTAGAFEFYADAQSTVGGGVAVLGAAAGVSGSTKHEPLNRAGDASRCAVATTKDGEPPEGCGALLRIEVVPLGEPKRLDPVCPAGTQWDGKQCIRTVVVTRTECPAGSHLENGVCAANVRTDCPAGMHFETGRGCVPNIAPAPGTPPPAPPAVTPPASLPPVDQRTGALAYSYSTGRFGWVVDRASRADAEAIATTNCNVADCKPIVWFKSCGAIAKGDTGPVQFSFGQPTREVAEAEALRSCQAVSGGCKGIAWGCNTR